MQERMEGICHQSVESVPSDLLSILLQILGSNLACSGFVCFSLSESILGFPVQKRRVERRNRPLGTYREMAGAWSCFKVSWFSLSGEKSVAFLVVMP